MPASVPVVSEAPHGTPGALARRMSLQPMQAGARRHSESRRPGESAETAARQGAATVAGRGLCGPAVRTVLLDLDLTPNQVWGLTQTDQEWSAALEAALTATGRDDLQHGTNAAYVAGCVCSECRGHQRLRMARNRRGAMSLRLSLE